MICSVVCIYFNQALFQTQHKNLSMLNIWVHFLIPCTLSRKLLKMNNKCITIHLWCNISISILTSVIVSRYSVDVCVG